MSPPRRGEEPGINLIPMLNLVSILIPFLLMAVQFVQLAVIDSSLPAIVGEGEGQDTEIPLTLLVHVGLQGLTVNGADAALDASGGVALGCAGGRCAGPDSYDWAGLTRLLAQIKDKNPEEESVILVPEERVPYEVVIRAMDATREDRGARLPDGRPRPLFPKVVLAAGGL